jgi:hypothetical protein
MIGKTQTRSPGVAGETALSMRTMIAGAV